MYVVRFKVLRYVTQRMCTAYVLSVRLQLTCTAYVHSVRAQRTCTACTAYVHSVRAQRTCTAYVHSIRYVMSRDSPVNKTGMGHSSGISCAQAFDEATLSSTQHGR